MAKIQSLRQRVWDKCKGVCILCGRSMIPNVYPPDPLAFTIEHLVPRCKGGTSDIDNLDGSHQWCNNFKRDALMEDLPEGYRRVLKWKIKHLYINRRVD